MQQFPRKETNHYLEGTLLACNFYKVRYLNANLALPRFIFAKSDIATQGEGCLQSLRVPDIEQFGNIGNYDII